MIGIYKITNKINNKVYIGQSVNVEKRFEEHKRVILYKNEHTYNYPLYRAMRKYEIKNFSFDLIEETTVEKLTEREQYWIDYYDCMVPKGYNQEPAEDAKRGENSNFAILTNGQADAIIDLLLNSSLLMSEIAEIFGVSGSCVEDINKGRRRVKQDISYPIRKNAKSFAHSGENNPQTHLTNAIVMEIRQRYVSETLPEIYKDYAHLVSFSALKKICYGEVWKHLPVYKKRKGIWISYN